MATRSITPPKAEGQQTVHKFITSNITLLSSSSRKPQSSDFHSQSTSDYCQVSLFIPWYEQRFNSSKNTNSLSVTIVILLNTGSVFSKISLIEQIIILLLIFILFVLHHHAVLEEKQSYNTIKLAAL